MAGPVAFCLVLGFLLLLVGAPAAVHTGWGAPVPVQPRRPTAPPTPVRQAGKVHFGYIYGFGAFGCAAINTLFALMSDR